LRNLKIIYIYKNKKIFKKGYQTGEFDEQDEELEGSSANPDGTT
jgi:hypothetical protein